MIAGEGSSGNAAVVGTDHDDARPEIGPEYATHIDFAAMHGYAVAAVAIRSGGQVPRRAEKLDTVNMVIAGDQSNRLKAAVGGAESHVVI